MRPNLFFFFFQAEDGIRDIGVTGVQTCALPISRRWAALRGAVDAEVRGVARAAEGLLVRREIDGAAEVRARGAERANLRALSHEPHGAEQLGGRDGESVARVAHHRDAAGLALG